MSCFIPSKCSDQRNLRPFVYCVQLLLKVGFFVSGNSPGTQSWWSSHGVGGDSPEDNTQCLCDRHWSPLILSTQMVCLTVLQSGWVQRLREPEKSSRSDREEVVAQSHSVSDQGRDPESGHQPASRHQTASRPQGCPRERAFALTQFWYVLQGLLEHRLEGPLPSLLCPPLPEGAHEEVNDGVDRAVDAGQTKDHQAVVTGDGKQVILNPD